MQKKKKKLPFQQSEFKTLAEKEEQEEEEEEEEKKKDSLWNSLSIYIIADFIAMLCSGVLCQAHRTEPTSRT